VCEETDEHGAAAEHCKAAPRAVGLATRPADRPVAVLVTGDAQQDRAAMIATNIAPAERSAARPPYGERARATQERGRSQQVLADGFAAASSDVDFDLRTRVRAVATEAERVVEETDPARDWATVDARLRAQLAHEGEHTCALLAARVTEIAAALATGVGGGLLRPFSAPAAPDLDAHLPTHDAPTGTRLPLAVRWRTLVMSGYGGLMMALILPRLAGVQLPVWLVVAGALVTTVFMAGAALSGERKRQLDLRRARAKALVRHTTDGFLLVMGKYTRDTLRLAQQHLRDESAVRAAGRRAAEPATSSAAITRSARYPTQRVGKRAELMIKARRGRRLA
jgi:hypothetical protein